MASQKHGISALGLQRELGLGSYRTSWWAAPDLLDTFLSGIC
jgi:hypothetical protein